MQLTRLNAMQCPIALSLDHVGDWWSIMIMRDAAGGLTRFDEFQKSLGIAPNILSCRLRRLVEAGILLRSRYSEHPPRHAYLLTERGQDFRPVLSALLAWGNKHFPPEGQAVVLIDSTTGQPADLTAMDWNRRPDQALLLSLHNTEVRNQP